VRLTNADLISSSGSPVWSDGSTRIGKKSPVVRGGSLHPGGEFQIRAAGP